jgi:YidC/Oxa1 family membrane protein insertase
MGEYKIGAKFQLKGKSYELYSNTFEVTERGFFSNLWLVVFYQPIYNFLIWLISLTPGHSLGAGIILLTVIIRLALYFPNQKALLAQKRLSEVQPKLNNIKEKYKDNQQKMAEETMKIWKEHKVNPVSSCLPMLIQFPFLIGLFHVIQDGLNPDKTWLLYNFISNFDFSSIQINFLSILNLKEKNLLVLPLIIGALQFLQLKLAMNKKPASKDKNDPNAIMQNTMLYLMPGMIAVFTASLPAGVGLYWGTSTLFAIVQQFFANKQVQKELSSITSKSSKNKKEDIRVIDIK